MNLEIKKTQNESLGIIFEMVDVDTGEVIKEYDYIPNFDKEYEEINNKFELDNVRLKFIEQESILQELIFEIIPSLGGM